MIDVLSRFPPGIITSCMHASRRVQCWALDSLLVSDEVTDATQTFMTDRCRFEGKEPEALAFAIMKHDTVWGSTSRAIVQLLRRGHKGRKQLGQMVEGVLISPEVDDFLDGLDTRPAQMHSVFHEGAWRAATRLFCLALPSQHTR